MTRLLVDLGHTRLKWAAAGPRGPERIRHGDPAALKADAAAATAVHLVSVVPEAARATLIDALGDMPGRLHLLTIPGDDLAVAAAYDGLGVDRWLAFNALWAARRRAFCLADIGSATTVDVVDDAGRHHGGWIAAGPATALSGLAARATALPAVTSAIVPDGPVRDTAGALGAGALLQQAGFIEICWLRACRHLGVPLELWLTGGGAESVQSAMPVPAQRDPDLVLKGLYELTRRQT